jgi:hypothetical protein
MSTIADKIDDVLKHRKTYLSTLAKVEESRSKLDQDCHKVLSLVGAQKSQVNNDLQFTFDQYSEKLYQLVAQIQELKYKINNTKSLFTKDAINIGVSGSARVGKSTLLKSISGLTDTQIPTGDSLPVTAVKSTIEYSDHEEIAQIEFHHENSFLQEVIGSYHRQLGVEGIPSTLDDFKKWIYPTPDEIEKRGKSVDRNISVLKRLLEIRDSIASFKHYLSGKTEQKHLEDLKPFVAYPEEAKSSNRPYLAVKKVHIKCKFPMVHIKKLILMDLPGLGDLGADIESHHVEGLKNNIDIVLMVKKSAVGQGFWQITDTETLDLLRKAKPISCSMQDFVFLIVNEDSNSTQKQIQNLIEDINAHINQNALDKQYQVINCNLMNSERVHQDLMTPVLNHLAKILPGKDLAILNEIEQQMLYVKDSFKQIMSALAYEIDTKSPIQESKNTGKLTKRVALLRISLNNKLVSLYDNLKQNIRKDQKTEEHLVYFHSIEEISAQLRQDLLENDLKSEKWKANAIDFIRFQGGAGAFAEKELNRIRVKISKTFSKMDVYLDDLQQNIFNQVNEIFKSEFIDILLLENLEVQEKMLIDKEVKKTTLNTEYINPNDNRKLLKLFANKLKSEGCFSLQHTLESFLKMKIEFKADYLPYARKVLNMLEPTYKDANGVTQNTLQPANVDNIERFHVELLDLTKKAIFEYQKELENQNLTADKIIFASVEELIDSLKFDENIEEEFINFIEKYRHLIWKEEYENVARYENLIKQIRNIVNTII